MVRNFAHLETANPKSLGNARLAVLYLEVYEEIIKVSEVTSSFSDVHPSENLLSIGQTKLGYCEHGTYGI